MRQFIILMGISHFVLGNDLSLSLEEAIKIAINNSLELLIAKEKIISAKERENQARGEFLPKLNLELETGYEKIKTPLEYSIDFLEEKIKVTQEAQEPWKNRISLTLKQRIYSGGELSSKIRLAKAQREYLEDEKEVARQDLIFSVCRAYWELKYSQHYVNFANEKVEMAKALLEIAKKKRKMGEITEIELREEEVRLASCENELAKARNCEQRAL
ncbi:MAG: TolC family protein, partial [bacterium]